MVYYQYSMNTYIALALVAFIPSLFLVFLPKKKGFFARPTIRGFGLGVYAALIAILLFEGFEHSGVVTGGLWFLGGIAISVILGFLVKEFHHHHDETEKAHRHNKASTLRLFVSDFFHNIVDGMTIIAAFAVNPNLGVTSLFGILGHQVIQQSGQQVLLVESGTSPWKAIGISCLVSLSVFLGLFITSEKTEMIFICFSAGIIVWKVLKDIRKTTWNTNTILGFVLGALLLTVLLLVVPHEH